MESIRRLRRLSFNPTIIVASLTANLLGMALPITMIQIYDRIIPNAGFQTLTVLILGVLGAILAEAAVKMARGVLLSRAGATFEASVYDQVLEALLEPQSTAMSGHSSGDLSTRLNSIDKVRAHYCSEGAGSLLDLPFIAIFLLMMLAISPLLCAVIVGLVCVVFAVVRFTRRKNLQLSLERESTDTRRQSFIVQTLFGVEFIKSVGIEQLMERRYERLMSGSAPIGAKLGARNQLNQGLTAVIGLLAPFVTTSVGAYLVIQGSMSVGGLAASVLLTGRVVQPVLRLEAYLGGRDAIRHAEAELAALLQNQRDRVGGSVPLNGLDEIELKDVSWKPDAGRPAILSNVSLRLARGDCISIAGGEGSGKSSLLSVLSGLIAPTSGEVLLNGQPIGVYAPAEVSQVVSTLTRENGLLDGTLLENLTGFRGPEFLENALELARRIGIDKFIEKHSSGMDMRVYSGGKSGLPNAIADSVVLIGGLAGAPDMILFDDANSRLDAEQDVKLLELLGDLQPDVIIVLITNRPSYLRLAEVHYRLDNGRLKLADQQAPLDLGRYARKCA